MSLPLAGAKVLDLTIFMAGPYCSMILGDLGAEVIKIETFPEGDNSRKFDPQVNGESYCFAMMNRNKKSLALDLKKPAGREVFLRLAAEADIVLENFRPGVARKLGIDHESLKAVNPALIYASISGFGQTGPYSRKGGFDIIAQGMSGIMTMTGEPDGRPAKVGIAMNDIAAGATALYAVLGAYIQRLRSGEGRYLETSLLESGLAWSIWEAGAFFGSGEVPGATGTRHRRFAPYQAYRTADGYVTVGAGSDKLWQSFCTEVCGKPEWLADPRFATGSSRVENVDALEQEIEAVLTTQPTAYWVERLDAAQVPAGPVYRYDQILADPHIRARDMIVEIEHPKMGPIKMLGLPVKSDSEFTAIRYPAPWLGQHSAEVLRAAGYDEARIEALFAEGVIHDSERPAA